jgi:hypothetical protein
MEIVTAHCPPNGMNGESNGEIYGENLNRSTTQRPPGRVGGLSPVSVHGHKPSHIERQSAIAPTLLKPFSQSPPLERGTLENTHEKSHYTECTLLHDNG